MRDVIFLSPQRIRHHLVGSTFDPYKDDAWAVGMMIYIHMMRRLPFTVDTTEEYLQAIIDPEIAMATLTHEDERWVDFAHKLLIFNEQARRTPWQIYNEIDTKKNCELFPLQREQAQVESPHWEYSVDEIPVAMDDSAKQKF